jgi:nucleoid-associated protein YgaU
VLPDSGAPSSTVVVPKIATTMVTRGDSLWRLSQTSYGAGMRYAVIYNANKEQIRNPNLIYPGQVFVMPAK